MVDRRGWVIRAVSEIAPIHTTVPATRMAMIVRSRPPSAAVRRAVLVSPSRETHQTRATTARSARPTSSRPSHRRRVGSRPAPGTTALRAVRPRARRSDCGVRRRRRSARVPCAACRPPPEPSGRAASRDSFIGPGQPFISTREQPSCPTSRRW
ncbi:hypothetical protein [Ornithinimicrobium kibberense]|uniref:hypothetical protein n=1 Tax=Ornithinimicrobium kibberense TaxID=282060 RepID=UPI00360B3E49